MAENETPADDLRSIMSAAYDEATKPEMVETKPVDETLKTEEAAETSEAKAARERDASGKFVKKTEAEEKADAKAADDKLAAEPKTETKPEETTDDKTAEKPTDGKEAPANWSASDKAMFALQTPEAKDFLLRRHRQMEADYTKKIAPLADLKKEYEPIQQMFAPHLDVLKAKGLTPAATIRAWANVETALANGRGVDIVAGMIKSYNIDKGAVARVLGFTSGTAAQPSTETKAAEVDPASTTHQPIALPPELSEELQIGRAHV